MPGGASNCTCCCPATRLLLCLTASLALHLSLVVSGSPFSRSSRTADSTTSAIIKAVLVSSESKSEISQSEGLSETITRDAVSSTNAKRNVSSPVDKATAEGEEVARDADRRLAGLLDSDRYHVRSELSQAPYVIDDVLIMAPPTKGAFAWRLRIRLFLSESGIVDRLVVEDSTAPVYVEEDAVNQFRSARYSPGAIDGQKVKSQLSIEVTEP